MSSNSILKLSDLPSEAWRLLGSFLGSMELAKLCQACPRLRVLICHHNGCDFLHVDFGLRRTVPRLAFVLPLRTLELIMGGNFVYETEGIRNLFPDLLNSLPKSLTSLKMHSANVYLPFFLERQRLKMFIPFEQLGAMLDLSKTFPQLRELDLFGRELQLMPSLLAHLPASLTRVKLDGTYSISPFLATVTTLPPNLVHLECRFSAIRLEKASFLSALAGLTCLETLRLADLSFTIDDNPLAHLPSSLTDLTLDVAWNLSTSQLALSRLHHLQRLEIRKQPVSDDAFFPNSLNSLSVFVGMKMPIQVLARLPPTLQHLTIPAPTEWNFSILPRTLLSLTLTSDILFIGNMDTVQGSHRFPEVLRDLPPSLTSLHLHTFSLLPLNTIAKCLPQTLTKTDSQFNFSKTCDKDLRSILPRSLTSLVGVIYGPAPWQETHPFDYISSLPERLESLEVSFFDNIEATRDPVDEKERMSWTVLGPLIPLLPPTLTELTVSDTSYLGDSCLLGLPRSLRKLWITHSVNKTMRMSFTTEGLKSMPPHLTELALVLNDQVDASFFPFLPNDLLCLSLIGLGNVEDGDIVLLPRKVSDLLLTPAKQLTNNCIPLLPPLITILKLPKVSAFTPDIIRLLPPFVTKIDIRSCCNFPRSLRSVVPPQLHIKTKKWATYSF